MKKMIVFYSHFIFIVFVGLLLLSPSFCSASHKIVKPESVEMSSKQLNKISEFVQNKIDEKEIGGMVALVARKGKIAYFKSFGLADEGKPMKKDAIFRIASMTKPITSLAVMMLYEDGKIMLNDLISKFIPEFKNPKVLELDDSELGYKMVPAKREITIHDLLTHQSGLHYSFLANWFPNDKKLQLLAQIYKKSGVLDGLTKPDDVTVGEVVKTLGQLPLYGHPGELYQYGLSYEVLGYLVEVISGMSLDKFMQKRIFKPLKMNDTFFYVPKNKVPRLSAVWMSPVPGRGLKRFKDGDIHEGDYLIYNPNEFFTKHSGSFLSGGAGLVSTVYDYYRFCQMLLNGGELEGIRVISPKTVELMTGVNHIGDFLETQDHGKGWRYGLGFGIQMDRAHLDAGAAGAFEWTGFYSTKFSVDPTTDRITVFMFQEWPRTALIFEIWDKIMTFSTTAVLKE